MLLPDGRVLVGSLNDANTYIFDPATSSWSNGPTKLYGDRSDEETWTKLADGSILSYDIWGNSQHAQRMDPTTMTWVDAGSVPVALSASDWELGPGMLLPDGRLFQVGAAGTTALYTPATTPGGTGTWAAGPILPAGLGSNDAPAAMLPNGHVLFAAGTIPGWNAPTHLFDFDPTAPLASSLTDVTPTSPNLSGTLVYNTRMLDLPSGQVLFDNGSSQLYVYTPSGSPQSAWKPTITSVVPNGNNYTLAGTQLNGLSAGASYGDDAEMDTNYPIIELRSGAGQIYFALVQLEQHGCGHEQYAGEHRFFAAGLDAVWNLFPHGGRQRHLLRSGVVHRRDRGVRRRSHCDQQRAQFRDRGE